MNLTCQGKERFQSFALAERVARARRDVNKQRHAYKCGECGSFHIGAVFSRRPNRTKVRGQSYITARMRHDEPDMELA